MDILKNLKPEMAIKVTELIRNYQDKGYEVVKEIGNFDPLTNPCQGIR